LWFGRFLEVKSRAGALLLVSVLLGICFAGDVAVTLATISIDSALDRRQNVKVNHYGENNRDLWQSA
jgi:hypothetical protein